MKSITVFDLILLLLSSFEKDVNREELQRWQGSNSSSIVLHRCQGSTRASMGDTWLSAPPVFGHRRRYSDELQRRRASNHDGWANQQAIDKGKGSCRTTSSS